jgi:hypothetical protein
VILLEFPSILWDFRTYSFSLLWKGSRDGFGAEDFHSRCHAHQNTLIIILDRNGNIFGGLAHVAWDSSLSLFQPTQGILQEQDYFKADPDVQCFLFTLKNPHDFREQILDLNEEKKATAYNCDSSYGPDVLDFVISDNCNANNDSITSDFGNC